ncbi:hypothetical protein B0J14DRAFT_600636 [Halenospora varia]|nr:hypothetical protein B0J14DRAFT_600636 [Halenospora varia]
MNSTTDMIGAYPPPPGMTPNFAHPDYIGYRVVIVAIVFPVLTLGFLLVRLYVKGFLIRQFHLDDYSIVCGFVLAVAFSTFQITQTSRGLGVHIWDVPFQKFKKYLSIGSIVGATTYNLGTLFIKVSILLFYLRLTQSRRIRTVTYIVMFISVGYCLIGAFALVYTCKPIRKYWDFSTPGTCINSGVLFLCGAALNVATDVVMLLLPIWLLWPLRLPAREKIGVTIILMMGSFVCVVSITRLAAIPPSLNDMDLTWTYATNITWCISEVYVGIICACLPSLKTFAKHHFPDLFSDQEFSGAILSGEPGPSLELSFCRLEASSDSSGVGQSRLSRNPSTSTRGQVSTYPQTPFVESIQRPERALVNDAGNVLGSIPVVGSN